jgi:hypothetical protein
MPQYVRGIDYYSSLATWMQQSGGHATVYLACGREQGGFSAVKAGLVGMEGCGVLVLGETSMIFSNKRVAGKTSAWSNLRQKERAYATRKSW